MQPDTAGYALTPVRLISIHDWHMRTASDLAPDFATGPSCCHYKLDQKAANCDRRRAALIKIQPHTWP